MNIRYNGINLQNAVQPSLPNWGDLEGWNAKEFDEENGMYYYSARYYAPPTFISRDPMFEDYPSISPYTYCKNNPVMFIDPTGETWVDIDGKAVTEDQQKNVKVYIFYSSDFKEQSEAMYKAAEAKYGKGSVALSNAETESEFVKDWGDMGGTNIKEINLNYHGAAQALTLNAETENYITSTTDGKTQKGNSGTTVQSLPTPKGNIKNAQLNINSCHSMSPGNIKPGSRLGEAFAEKFNFSVVRGTFGGVNYNKNLEPVPQGIFGYNWEYIIRGAKQKKVDNQFKRGAGGTY